VELVGSFAYVLNWKLCKNGEVALVWVYVGCDDVDFNNEIEGNILLITKIEEEQNEMATKL
jgi:hypothetical protein